MPSPASRTRSRSASPNLGASAAWSTAIWMGVLGAVAIFVADHFVRPVFMAARLPVVVALLGIIGGLETFGVLGLFVGPTLLAVVAAVWRDLATAGSASCDLKA